MDLIIEKGYPTERIKNYPEEERWVKMWLENQQEFIFTTSGSSGPPKSIVFTREQIIASAQRTAELFHWFPDMHALHTLPMSFVAGRMNILRALIGKQSLWKVEPQLKYSAADFNAEISIDWWTLTPAMLESFIPYAARLFPQSQILVGGGRVSERLKTSVMKMGQSVWESYGAAETLTHVAVRKLNGENVMQGFEPIQQVTFKATVQGLKISDALLNQEVQTMDDWSQLDNGQWVMNGRMDDLINTGGVKVYPTQVEEIIDRFVDFESFVKASPDDTLGEVITWVVPMEAVIPENWKLWFEQYPILQPRKIERVQELPRNRNGKWKRK